MRQTGSSPDQPVAPLPDAPRVDARRATVALACRPSNAVRPAAVRYSEKSVFSTTSS